MLRWTSTCLVVVLPILACRAAAQSPPIEPVIPPVVRDAKPVTVEHIKVHGSSLEGNLEGDPADRDVAVYLPPSYRANASRRYPVVYALHGYLYRMLGFTAGSERWANEIHAPQIFEGAFATNTREMIIVLPGASTARGGSMYSNSTTVGNWEDFIAHDLVSYVDSHYRTLPDRLSRGLMGHSMGGYGTLRIGMKHPEIFGTLYIMSPCCLSGSVGPAEQQFKQMEQVKTAEEESKLPFLSRVGLAEAAAWSPNPQNPPFFADLPTKDGVGQPSVLARWSANQPLFMMHQYIPALRKYRGIAIDVGDEDNLKPDAAEFHRLLDSYGIVNSFEVYHGTHVSAVPERIQNHALPFFSTNLQFDSTH